MDYKIKIIIYITALKVLVLLLLEIFSYSDTKIFISAMSMYLSPNRPSHIMHDDLDGVTKIQAVAGRFSAIQPTMI